MVVVQLQFGLHASAGAGPDRSAWTPVESAATAAVPPLRSSVPLAERAARRRASSARRWPSGGVRRSISTARRRGRVGGRRRGADPPAARTRPGPPNVTGVAPASALPKAVPDRRGRRHQARRHRTCRRAGGRRTLRRRAPGGAGGRAAAEDFIRRLGFDRPCGTRPDSRPGLLIHRHRAANKMKSTRRLPDLVSPELGGWPTVSQVSCIGLSLRGTRGRRGSGGCRSRRVRARVW